MTDAAPVTGRDHGLVDIAIIGGGINGAGIARDAAGRGLKVLLCEKGDFAEGTSSRSGKLVHVLRLPVDVREAALTSGMALAVIWTYAWT